MKTILDGIYDDEADRMHIDVFSIIYKEMQWATILLCVILLFHDLLSWLDLKHETGIGRDAEAIVGVLIWFAFVAYRSVGKLAEVERTSKSHRGSTHRAVE
jgi:hypothetical protein